LKYDVIFDVTASRCVCDIIGTILLSYVKVFVMSKLSSEDKIRIQTLREQGLGAKAIRASYPDKNWSLSTLQMICRRVDETHRVDLFSGGQAWYEQKFSPDSQTTQHQCNFGPSNCQTRSQFVSVSTRVSSSPLGRHKTEMTRAFQSSAQTTDY